MNAEEFLSEALASPICPPDFKETYEYFKKYQEMSLKCLLEFHRICKKNGINYHVTYGSLLGLIRDGGQIPWDYDIDVFVPIYEKDKLLEALKNDLSDEFYAMCPEFDSSCRHYILRLCPKNYDSAAIHLDVFYFCGCPTDEQTRKQFSDKIKTCSKVRYSKKVEVKKEATGNWKRFIKYSVAKAGSVLFSMKKIDRQYNELVFKYPVDECEFVTSADIFAGDYTFKTEMLTKTIDYSVNGITLSIPENYKEFLVELYGDYMSYPSLERRIKQVLHASGRFKYFEKFN